MRRIVLIVVLVAVLAAAGTGIAFAVRGGSGSSPDAQAAQFERQWRADLRTGARSDPTSRFPSPSFGWLAARLQDAYRVCHCFTVVQVTLLHPRQVAPLVIVEAKDELAFFFHRVAIFRRLVLFPATGASRRSQYAYEGFFLEAQNSAGVPFFATELTARLPGDIGNTWAARNLP